MGQWSCAAGERILALAAARAHDTTGPGLALPVRHLTIVGQVRQQVGMTR